MSKALLISIGASSAWYAGFGVFKPSCMCCVNVVSSVFLECRTRKPSCEGDSGLCEVIFVRTSLSNILTKLQSNEIGPWEADSVGVLFGLRMGTL